MALANIITKIKTDAENESERITRDAQGQAREILSVASQEAETILKMGRENAIQLEKETHDRILSSAIHRAKLASETFKTSLIERTFADIQERLSQLSSDTYKVFIVNAVKRLPEKEGIVTVSSERKDETITILEEAGINCAHVHEASIVGGFVLETKTAVYDNSLKKVIAHSRNQFSGEVAQTLFK